MNASHWHITSFFDGLDHIHLHKMWCKILDEKTLPIDHFNIYKSTTTYSTVERARLEFEFSQLEKKEKKIRLTRICTPIEFREKVRKGNFIEKNPFKNKILNSPRYNKTCGIPQGSPISACLSNIYMIDFDIKIHEKVNELGGLYKRYCDDIIIIVKPEDALSMKDFVLKTIVEYHLEINDNKTDSIIFKTLDTNILKSFDYSSNLPKEKNMQYLGFEFNGESAYIRSSSLSRYYRRMTNSFFSCYARTEQMWIQFTISNALKGEIKAKEIDEIVSPHLNELKKTLLELQIYFHNEEIAHFTLILDNINSINTTFQNIYFDQNRNKTIIEKSNDFLSIRNKKLIENDKIFNNLSYLIKKSFV